MRCAAATSGVLLLYRSSNGDEWHYVRDDLSGREVVLHTANPASRGRVTQTGLVEFLTLGNGPEQDELRRLMGTPDPVHGSS